jgi:hypothetical protein
MSWLVFSSQLSALGGSAVVTAINENGMTAMKIAENRRDAELTKSYDAISYRNVNHKKNALPVIAAIAPRRLSRR